MIDRLDACGELAVSRVRARLFGGDVPPLRIDRYQLLARLGQGGMGVVYEALDPTLGRRVALKLLRSDARVDMAPEQRRLQREAQALARLSHPNVATVYEVGTSDDSVFVAMELVDGPTLRQWLEREKPRRAAVIALFVEAGRGLAAAHAAGLVHRDFKPDNVLVGSDGRPRVVDFGLARPPIVPVDPLDATQGDSAEIEITHHGMVVGTPSYMAPEQLHGEAVDARADQFAFCVALFEALTGVRPYAGRTIDEISRSIAKRAIDGARLGPRVPRSVRRALLRGLDPDPARRFPTMDALLEELVPRRRGLQISLAASAALALPLSLVAWNATISTHPCDAIEAELATTWNDGRRRELADAFVHIDRDAGPTHWRRVEPVLDAWANDWLALYRGACESAHVEGELSLRDYDRIAGCLDDGRRRLLALTDRFADLDRTTLGEATKASLSLPRPSDCADAPQLEQPASTLEDPIVRAEVVAIQEALADVEALDALGRFDEALAQVVPAVRRARAIGVPTIEAEAIALEGKLRLQRGDTTDALHTLEDAVMVAFKANHQEVVFTAANRLAFAEGYLRHDTEAAMRWAARAQAALDALGHEPRFVAGYHDNLGTVLYAASRRDEARSHYERALAAAEAALGPDHPAVAGVLSNLSSLERDTGDLDRARTLAQRALTIREATVPDHPDTALVVGNLATIDLVSGRTEIAIAGFERALAIYANTTGLETLNTAILLSRLGVALDDAGRSEEALPRHEQALHATAVAAGESSPQYARSLTNLGRCLLRLDRDAEAKRYLEQALVLKRAIYGESHPELAVTLRKLGDATLDLGELESAKEHYTRAEALYAEAPGNVALDLARSRLGRARAEAALGSAATAKQLAMVALDALERNGAVSEEIEAARAFVEQGK